MNTVQLFNCLTKIIKPPTKFLGVFPKNQIPAISSMTYFPVCFIANTDESTLPGSHWVAFWFDSPHYCEFFDSYGIAPHAYGFDVTISSYNHQTLQSFNSSVCGQYCLYY